MEPQSFALVRTILKSPLFRSQNLQQQKQTLDQIIATGEISTENVFKLIMEVQREEEVQQQTVRQQSPIKQVVKKLNDQELNDLMGKPSNTTLSNRSKISLERLYEYLANNYPDMQLMATVDNGDCYYDAFAKSVSIILGRIVTIQDLRAMVSDYVNDPNNDLTKIKRLLKNNFMEFVNYVHEDYNLAKANNRYPVWGNTQIDGEILCKYYFNLNLREISEGFLDESLSLEQGLAVETNRVAGDVFYPWGESPETRQNTVFIGNIPAHYLAIVPKNKGNLQPNQPYIRKYQSSIVVNPIPMSPIRTSEEMFVDKQSFSPNPRYSAEESEDEQEEWTEEDAIVFCDAWLEGSNRTDNESIGDFLQYLVQNDFNINNIQNITDLCNIFNKRRMEAKTRKEAEAKRKADVIREQLRQQELQTKQKEEEKRKQQADESKRIEELNRVYQDYLQQAQGYLRGYYEQSFP